MPTHIANDPTGVDNFEHTDINYMGIDNKNHGVCGFTSALYAIYMNRPELRVGLLNAMSKESRSTRIMSEIKIFLLMLKAEKNISILTKITEFNRQHLNISHWTIDLFLNEIQIMATLPKIPKYDIGMPPEAIMLYLQRVWGMRPVLTEKSRHEQPGDSILGLSVPSRIGNKWKNLAHYVYESRSGIIYSFGERYLSLSTFRRIKKRPFHVAYRIMLHGGNSNWPIKPQYI